MSNLINQENLVTGSDIQFPKKDKNRNTEKHQKYEKKH